MKAMLTTAQVTKPGEYTKKIDPVNITGHYTAKGYVSESPDAYATMKLETITFSPIDGTRTSKPTTATFCEKDWSQFLQFGASVGLEVIEILHLPKGWPMPEIATR